MADFTETLAEMLAREAVRNGEPVDEVCARYKRDWSAHERLTLHQEAQGAEPLMARVEQLVSCAEQFASKQDSLNRSA
jgi:hypothetical protein